METTHRTPVLTRSSIELAVLLSLTLLTISLAFSMFLNIAEAPLTLGAIVTSCLIGFRRPAARISPMSNRHLHLVGGAA